MATVSKDSFGAKSTLKVGAKTYEVFRLDALEKKYPRTARLPVSLKVLLESLLRNEDDLAVQKSDIEALASWKHDATPSEEIAFYVARVLLQDFTGVPCVVDLAAMRDAFQAMGGDPKKINPLRPADLVVDHSVQVDSFGTSMAFGINARLENERNKERYALLKWGQHAFNGFRVVPPDTGIVHQVNIEYLASVVFTEKTDGSVVQAFPDTLVGTDSHTTMVNGLGVVGWGVGGIEAEACMLGEPIPMLIPRVVGFKLSGRLREGATATDLVLTATQMLRKHKVVGKFVEFYGPGLSALSLPDRATLANMAPEYGATIGFFPVDVETIAYLKLSGRSDEQCALVESYCKAQGMWRDEKTLDPIFSETLELDLATVEPSLAGPRRPQDRVPLKASKREFRKALFEMCEKDPQLDQERVNRWLGEGGSTDVPPPELGRDETLGKISDSAVIESPGGGVEYRLAHGHVVIAAITSCTNTSNPAVLIAAGLLAKKAVERGLSVKPWVKTSLAPGSKVVTQYLKESGLLAYLEALKFHVVGYGCTTCIGNSGPLPDAIANAVKEKNLVVAAVLSGNRNFEGRINPHVRMNYLASPPLVVAYALAGEMDIDLLTEPLGYTPNGEPVLLKDIWPTNEEIADTITKSVKPEQFRSQYGKVFDGDENWRAFKVPEGVQFAWDAGSTYVKRPPYFEGMPAKPGALTDVKGARCLAVFGDSITTDHISPAGDISEKSPAGEFLKTKGVTKYDFNSYGARRGNHEVMMRGTFANIRLKNVLVPGTEGWWTVKFPSEMKMPIFEASMQYQQEKTPLVILAGAEYGTGSSRDWAAKGTLLLGVRAVIATSFERIHRSNLVGMGVLPLQFEDGVSRESLGLTGKEIFDIEGITSPDFKAGAKLTVKTNDGKQFSVLCRIDTPKEVDYYKHGGILQYVLRKMAAPKVA